TSNDMTENIFAEVGLDSIRISTPVFAGDTLTATSVVLEVSDAAETLHSGLMKYRIVVQNQNGAQVLSMNRIVLLKRRSYWSNRDQEFVRTHWKELGDECYRASTCSSARRMRTPVQVDGSANLRGASIRSPRWHRSAIQRQGSLQGSHLVCLLAARPPCGRRARGARPSPRRTHLAHSGSALRISGCALRRRDHRCHPIRNLSDIGRERSCLASQKGRSTHRVCRRPGVFG